MATLASRHFGRLLVNVMLTLTADIGHRLCNGISRHSFLQAGTLLGGLCLPELLQKRAHASPSSDAKSVILIYLGGGPSHLDTYDMKPTSPAEYRGELQPISTNVPGMQICELLPRQSQMADRFSVVRSMTWQEPDHQRFELCTGFPVREQRASFGGLVSRFHSGATSALPTFVSLSGADGELREAEDPRYAGAHYRPFVPSDEGLANMSLQAEISLPRIADRQRLLSELDAFRRRADSRTGAEPLDDFTAQALSLMSSPAVREAFDLELESPKMKERYGSLSNRFLYHRSESYWDFELFIRARRLVEAGVPLMTLQVGVWDHHCGPDLGTLAESYRTLLPLYDQSLAALLDDLHERGLSERVAVVVWGEFGRTPKLKEFGGRDHWPGAGSVLFAGGGLRMGQLIGETDAGGERPNTRQYGPQNVFATLYQLLGIDPGLTVPNHAGRPMYLLDDSEPIAELLI
jgi:hypothetical protein